MIAAQAGVVWNPADRTLTFGGGVIRFTVPAGASFVYSVRPTHCRSCDAPVLFVNVTRTGRRSPIDPDGTSHFATCPDAARWRRSKRGAGPQAVTAGQPDASADEGSSHLPEGS